MTDRTPTLSEQVTAEAGSRISGLFDDVLREHLPKLANDLVQHTLDPENHHGVSCLSLNGDASGARLSYEFSLLPRPYCFDWDNLPPEEIAGRSISVADEILRYAEISSPVDARLLIDGLRAEIERAERGLAEMEA